MSGMIISTFSISIAQNPKEFQTDLNFMFYDVLALSFANRSENNNVHRQYQADDCRGLKHSVWICSLIFIITPGYEPVILSECSL